MDNIQQLKQWIDGSDRIVFFGGAGVSTESGIPDFRSVDGLYNQKYDYPPETILSHSFFMAHPEEYYKFHRDKLVVDGARPNRAHLRLAELEREGKLQAEVLIVGGTSLAVYPAAGLLNYYRGNKLVLINRSATPYDDQANLIIHEKIGEVFAQV